MTVGSDPEEQVVRPALEAALDVAEAGLVEKPPRQPPRGLRSVLGFHKRPSTALSAVRRVLDRDEVFRALVRERIDTDRLSPGAAAFLVRDDGWRNVVDQAARAVEEAADGDRSRAAERAAAEQVATLKARVDELETEAAERNLELKRLREVERRAEGDRELAAEVASANEALTAERQRAVRELAAERRRLAERTAQVRGLSDELEGLRRGGPGTPPGEEGPTGDAPHGPSAARLSDVDLADALAAQRTRADAAEAASREAAGAVARVAQELATLAERLDPDATLGNRADPDPGAGAVDSPRAKRRNERVARRRPIRVGRGLREGSAAATRALLETPGLVLWVDGYNASMALWGELDLGGQREALIGTLGRLATACGTLIRVVFDGDSGGPPAVTTPLPVRVFFTAAGVEADDDILDAVAATDASVPVAVLSADRRVRDGAAARGANLLSPEDLRTVLANGG